MIHLEVKPDGLIYLIKDCPEEPKYTDFVQHTKYYWQVNKFERAKRDYQQALASCERILCADQEQARDLIFKPGLRVIIDKDFSNGGEVTLLEWAKLYAKVKDNSEPWQTMKYRLTIKPGIYSIPNVEWERVNYCTASDCPGCPHKCLRPQWKAELKESTPSTEQESQEELTALDLKMFIEHELGGYKTVHMGRSYRVINRQFVYESDIMSLAEDLLRNFTITRKK